MKQKFQSIPILISLNKLGIFIFFKNKRIKTKYIKKKINPKKKEKYKKPYLTCFVMS